MTAAAKSKFTPDDISHLVVSTHLLKEQDQGAMVKFLALSDQSTAARILHKELMPRFLESTGDLQKGATTEGKKINFKSRARQVLRNELPHMAKIFQPSAAPSEEKKIDVGAKFQLENKVAQIPKPLENQKTTGSSIAGGNYLNLATKPGEEREPTWKKLQNSANNMQNFYANAFNMNNKKREQPDDSFNNPAGKHLEDALNQSANFLATQKA